MRRATLAVVAATATVVLVRRRRPRTLRQLADRRVDRELAVPGARRAIHDRDMAEHLARFPDYTPGCPCHATWPYPMRGAR